jgi:glycerol-3-phosphate dehydrogenase
VTTTVSPDREVALTRAADGPLDVVVVGAGITGAGVALDAALRGYRVALIEREDIASGTSSKSSKLVHGGLRYLANGDVAMVAEGVRERDRTRRAAPHLVRPLPFVVATPTLLDRVLLKAGLLAYDALGTVRSVAPHGRVSVDELRRVAPTLQTQHGGYRYWDARTDDARLTLAVVQAARRAGVLVVNHAAVTSITTTAAERVTGVEVTDELTGTGTTLEARWIVGATGVWAAELRRRAPAGDWSPEITPARGAHLVFDHAALPVSQAVVFPAGDGRHLFAIPWGGQVYVGTNDVPASSMAAHVTRDDADYLLAATAAAFDHAPDLDDAVGAWAGLRPLVGGGERTADLSRRHLVVEDPAGLVTVTGGKLTTWRQMAQDVVDELAAGDGVRARCTTATTSLGATGTRRAGDARVRVLGARHGVDPIACSALYHRHGDRAPDVLAACLAEDDGTAQLVDGLPYLRGEVRWAVRHELARTVDDVLQRRTRVSLRHAAAGGDAIAFVADVLDEELGIDRDAQMAAYLAAVDAERGPLVRR